MKKRKCDLILCKQNSSITFDEVNDKYEMFLALSIKNMFSLFIKKPKILLNISPNINLLVPFLKTYANVKVLKNSCIGIFSYMVHYGEYDLGLYFYESEGSIKLNIYSGSGYPLSKHEFCFFENEYQNLLNCKNLSNYTNNNIVSKLKNHSNRVNKQTKIYDFEKLLYGEGDRFIKKWGNKYIKFLKSVLLKTKSKISVVVGNKIENYFLKQLFNNKNIEYNLYCGKNIYMYKNEKLLNLENLINYKCINSLCIENEEFIHNNQLSKNDLIKHLLENEKDCMINNNQLYVIKNAFDFENISKVIFLINHLAI